MKVHFQFFHLYTLLSQNLHSFPHTRGGDPRIFVSATNMPSFSPHTWGLILNEGTGAIPRSFSYMRGVRIQMQKATTFMAAFCDSINLSNLKQ